MSAIIRFKLLGSHLTHNLPSDLHADTISARLGFQPYAFPDQGTAEWEGHIAGQPFAIWDYKGAKWSVYAPTPYTVELLRRVFPELY